MAPLRTRLARTPHPVDRHPPPAQLPRIPTVKRDPPATARRAHRRSRRLNTPAQPQPGIDPDLEHEYDLHRLPCSAHDPRVLATPRGSTRIKDRDILNVIPADSNPIAHALSMTPILTGSAPAGAIKHGG